LSAFPYSSSYVYEYPACKESYNNIKIVNLTSDSSKEQMADNSSNVREKYRIHVGRC